MITCTMEDAETYSSRDFIYAGYVCQRSVAVVRTKNREQNSALLREVPAVQTSWSIPICHCRQPSINVRTRMHGLVLLHMYILHYRLEKEKEKKKITNIKINFLIRTVHRDIIKVFYSPTNAQVIVLKKKLRGLSPRANYTDRAAAAGRRS